jgi:hypothetical protein
MGHCPHLRWEKMVVTMGVRAIDVDIADKTPAPRTLAQAQPTTVDNHVANPNEGMEAAA